MGGITSVGRKLSIISAVPGSGGWRVVSILLVAVLRWDHGLRLEETSRTIRSILHLITTTCTKPKIPQLLVFWTFSGMVAPSDGPDDQQKSQGCPINPLILKAKPPCRSLLGI